jgi:hypothetical protein
MMQDHSLTKSKNGQGTLVYQLRSCSTFLESAFSKLERTNKYTFRIASQEPRICCCVDQYMRLDDTRVLDGHRRPAPTARTNFEHRSEGCYGPSTFP